MNQRERKHVHKARKSYSAYIYALIAFLKTVFPQLKIIKYAKLPCNIAGRCNYEKNWIKLNEPNAQQALMTLAHEAGHYTSYIRNKDKINCCYEDYYSEKKREQLAYLYGWSLMVMIGATSIITKEMWKELHKDI